MTNKCTSNVGNFNGHGGAPEQYRCIAQWSMSRATLEATGRHHRATACSILPQRPPGQQQTKQWQKNGPTLLDILMAVVVRRYNTVRIAGWRRSRALVEATGHRHWASIAADSFNRSCICQFFLVYSSSTGRKRSRVNAKDPFFNRGMTYQMKEKGLTA